MWMVVWKGYKSRAVLQFLKAGGLFPVSLIVRNIDTLLFKNVLWYKVHTGKCTNLSTCFCEF